MTLSTEDFPAFFKAVHDAEPYLWQRRLLDEVVQSGWPATIAAPTGAGKTAVLDVALFHLALEAAYGETRKAPLRIVFAVDRRVIVDQAHDRAMLIQSRIKTSDNAVIQKVRAALSSLSRDQPLHVEQLRGGMPREDDWVRNPSQPTIMCATVDQLGSRLLFRGYGVSRRMAPVHAGLLGEDALILLDEAHLARAFEDTLQGVARWRRSRKTHLPERWEVSSLTATPQSNKPSFSLQENERAEGDIAKRLDGPQADKPFKPARLVLSPVSSGTGDHAEELAEKAKILAKETAHPAPVTAVIVNRVALARRVFDLLRRDMGEECDVILLTGRVRPVERDELIRKYRYRLENGSEERMAKPLFVVATQCIEAGADFDFDALVTQIAPLDALRQRFGRLNRRGGKMHTPAIIIAAKDEVSARANDVVYEDRAKRTWEWLNAHAVKAASKGEADWLDFGPSRLDAVIDGDRDEANNCLSVGRDAPVLRRADVEAFSVTSPPPYPDPHLPLFLHGDLRVESDVSIIWRGDIEDIWSDEVALKEVLYFMPPKSGEALAVPLWQVRRWLAGEVGQADDIADLPAPAPEEKFLEDEKLVLRWRGPEDDETGLVYGSSLRPGDTIVVPSSYGGCDNFGWAPRNKEDVIDIADLAAAPYEGRRAALRLHPAFWDSEASDDMTWEEFVASLDHDGKARDLVEDACKALGDDEEPSFRASLKKRLEAFSGAKNLQVLAPYRKADQEEDPKRGIVLFAPKGIGVAAAGIAGEAVTDGDDEGSFRSSALSLDQHRKDVEEKACAFAKAVGLPLALVKTLALAGRLHDDGKADPRFQFYLGGGRTPDEPLAKSDRLRAFSEKELRRLSDLPERWRHEALSVRIAIERLRQNPHEAEIDAALALWLVGTHHGYGRPFFPHDDPWDDHVWEVDGIPLSAAPGPQRLDFEWEGLCWAELFETLKQRYGIWGLAYLEAILRLADHRASEAAETKA